MSTATPSHSAKPPLAFSAAELWQRERETVAIKNKEA